MSRKVIDVWAQHPTSRFIQHPCFDSLKRWMAKKGDIQEVPLAFTEAAMGAANVEKALLAAWYAPGGSLISNEELLSFVQTYPQRFAGLVSADLSDPVKAVQTLRRYVQDHDFKGLRIVQWLWDKPCTDPLYYPLLTTCVELDVPVCLQVGLTGPLCTSSTGSPLHIERIALDFPDLKIVCGHIGYPWHLEMIAFARKFPNVYIDTSAYLPKRYPAELVSYMNRDGRKKVMFGTNFPMLMPSDCLAQIDDIGLSEEVMDAFLYQNAKSLFKL